jgi:BirA family biotin operon repressor/biotin-[acetyl-CoA-carboxylase] ligase
MATLFIGQNKIFLTEVNSTNSYASSLLKNVNPPEGTVVYAGHQTEGKGQRGNSWKAEPSRNITLSLILKPVFLNVEKSFYLSKITALALHDVLTELLAAGQFDIKIKWPNDILLNGRKVAGVLLENGFKENYIANCITGIGLNVNQVHFGELSAVATSLAKETSREFDLDRIMASLFSHYEKWYLQLRNRKLEEINTHYLERLFKMNTTAEFEHNSKRFEAKIKGVSETGLLLLEMNGAVSSFDIKDVKLIY